MCEASCLISRAWKVIKKVCQLIDHGIIVWCVVAGNRENLCILQKSTILQLFIDSLCHWFQNHLGFLWMRQQDLNRNANMQLQWYQEALKPGHHSSQGGLWWQHPPCGWEMSKHPSQSSRHLHRSRVAGEFLTLYARIIKLIDLVPAASLWYTYEPAQIHFLHHAKLSLETVPDILVVLSSWETERHDPWQSGRVVCSQKPSGQSPLYITVSKKVKDEN